MTDCFIKLLEVCGILNVSVTSFQLYDGLKIPAHSSTRDHLTQSSLPSSAFCVKTSWHLMVGKEHCLMNVNRSCWHQQDHCLCQSEQLLRYIKLSAVTRLVFWAHFVIVAKMFCLKDTQENETIQWSGTDRYAVDLPSNIKGPISYLVLDSYFFIPKFSGSA